MDEIIIEPGNPNDFDASELEALAASIADQTETPTRAPHIEEYGYGTTLHEVIHVWVPWHTLEGAVAAQVVNILFGWLKERWKRDEQEHPGQARPRTVVIWGADNRPIRSVVVKSDIGEPEEEAPEKLAEHPDRRRPGAE